MLHHLLLIDRVLLILALLSFLGAVAGKPVALQRLHLVAFGLALWVLSELVATYASGVCA
jgi:hypothetical protein